MPDEQWAELAVQHPVLQMRVLDPYDLTMARLDCCEVDLATHDVCWSLIAMATTLEPGGLAATGPVPELSMISRLIERPIGEVQAVVDWLCDFEGGNCALSIFAPSDRYPEGCFQLELLALPARCSSQASPRSEQLVSRIIPPIDITPGPVSAPERPQEAPAPLPWYRRMQHEVIGRRRALGGHQA